MPTPAPASTRTAAVLGHGATISWPKAPTFILGLGLGGFIDGIVLHGYCSGITC
jgi:hypothetical protein